MKVLVLGAGRVGQAIARDLAADRGRAVTVADRSASALAAFHGVPDLATAEADLSSAAEIQRLSQAHDLVVGALPSFLGYAALKAVLETGRSYVDISFFEENPFSLDELAREHGATAVVDCGVAPGLDNLILGRLLAEMERVDRFVCQVGGLPRVRTAPWEYRAPFAPYDVLNEYTRPARWVWNGRPVVDPPLTHRELVEIPGLGTLEAFLTDGLRTLLTTVEVPFMQEKTLRYPGHADRIALLRDAGFLSAEPIEVGGREVRPLDLTSRLLFPLWELGDEEDLTAFRVEIDGVEGGQPVRRVFTLLDRRDPVTGISSMARTTGYTCTAIARLVADGRYRRPGVSAPEHVGADRDAYRSVLADLSARNVALVESREAAPAP